MEEQIYSSLLHPRGYYDTIVNKSNILPKIKHFPRHCLPKLEPNVKIFPITTKKNVINEHFVRLYRSMQNVDNFTLEKLMRCENKKQSQAKRQKYTAIEEWKDEGQENNSSLPNEFLNLVKQRKRRNTHLENKNTTTNETVKLEKIFKQRKSIKTL